MSEDHELFRLLEKINPTRAKTIVTSIIRSPSDYEKDINKIQMARDQLVRAASGSDGTPDTTAASVPTGLTATAVSGSQINLSWNASTDNVGVSGYRIHRNGVQIATSDATTYSDTGLAANTRYNYTVSAYDAAGNDSAQSNSVSATAQAVAAGGSAR
jgi:fibronectin type 3 domain-containing protein